MLVNWCAVINGNDLMAELIEPGTWVEIHNQVLPAGERAPQVPEDTQLVPLQMRAKGFLVGSASLGDEVKIVTTTGRQLPGTLIQVNPAYSHQFGAPIPELSTIGVEVREILRKHGYIR